MELATRVQILDEAAFQFALMLLGKVRMHDTMDFWCISI